MAAYDGPMDAGRWTPQTVTAAVLQLAGDLAEHLRAPARSCASATGSPAGRPRCRAGCRPACRQVLESQRAREQLLPLVTGTRRRKQAREVLDHGDQVALAARIAARHPEVGAAERGRYQVVLLDEYQDTSHAQLVLLRALFGGGHPVTAVGDPCQSIYGWRGASAGNLRRFATDFPARSGSGRAGPPAVDQLPQRRAASSTRPPSSRRELRAEAPDVPLLVPAPGPRRPRAR